MKAVFIVAVLMASLCSEKMLVNAYFDYANLDLCSNRCVTCSAETNRCTQCGKGFYLHPVFKWCVKWSNNNCDIMQTKFACQTCGDGYFNDLGTCLACTISNCKKCDSFPSECSTCADGKYGVPSCTTSCGVTNCASCTDGTSTGCTDCVAGYYKNVNACSACTATNCKTCSGNVCGTCKDGYYLTAYNKCGVCRDGCLVCDQASGICEKCDTEHVLSPTKKDRYFMKTDLECHKEPAEPKK